MNRLYQVFGVIIGICVILALTSCESYHFSRSSSYNDSSRESDHATQKSTIAQIRSMQSKGLLTKEEADRLIHRLTDETTGSQTEIVSTNNANKKQQVAPVQKEQISVAEPPEEQDKSDDALAHFDSYKAESSLRGRLRSVGSDTMDRVMALWEQDFHKKHPALFINHEGKGSSTATPALIEGRAELGPMSRPMKEAEVARFEEHFGYKATQFPVAIDALAVYVHPDNPIADKGLTLAELDAVFSNERKRGHDTDIRTWGELGLTGKWSNAPIRMYGRNKASGTHATFKKLVLQKGAYKDAVQEKVGSAEIVRSIAADPFSIGYSGIGYKTPDVAVAPLAKEKDGKTYPPTMKAANSGNYALARFLYVTLNIDPDKGASDLQREFINYAYSREGQKVVLSEGFFPVSKDIAQKAITQVAGGTTGPLAIFRTYTSNEPLHGRLRSVGSDTMDRIMALWEKSFREFHPQLFMRHEGKGSSTAPPALIEGRSEVGPMSRPMKTAEMEKFVRHFNYEPTQLPVAVDALAVYVHPDNPIIQQGITLAQLDAIFSAERKRGHDSDIVKWGDLGLGGKWANAPIRLYGRNNASGTHSTFKKLVLQKGAFKDSIQEKVGSAEIVRSIASDPFGIGYSGIGYKTDNVGVCPLASEPGEKAYGPEMKHAYNGNYPLARFLYLTFNINPKNGVTPVQKEFIKFVFSRKGQRIVTNEGFFPVSEELSTKALAIANE